MCQGPCSYSPPAYPPVFGSFSMMATARLMSPMSRIRPSSFRRYDSRISSTPVCK